MLWKNPFLIKNSEQYSDASEFLSIFDSSVLKMISEENLSKVSFISSTPGAGKTSLFKAFSPSILKKVANTKQEEYLDIQKNLKRIGVIENGKSTLLSINISCARGYNIIDSMFSNGRRMQVLFALLNYRIIILFFNSICTLFDLTVSDLEMVTFATIPDEIISERNHFINAYEAYEWACRGERALCDYLDDDIDGSIELSFVHMSLIALKLLEPDNIVIDGKKELQYTLIIFDDFHKLTNRQQKNVSDSAYLLKSKCGVWFGQRLEGLEPATIISLDGSLGRDYNPNVYIDNYWSDNSNKKLFYSLLENIANKRVVSSHYLGLTHFGDCIADEVDIDKSARDRLINYILSIKKIIFESVEYKNKYSYFIDYIEENNASETDVLQKAVLYESIKIHINRSLDGQLRFYLGEVFSLEEMIDFYTKVKDPALYYVCWMCELPFYFGLDKLKQLSSFNIEQFLYFSAQLFDFVHTKNLNTRSIKVLNAKEQEKCIKASSGKRWLDIDRRYENTDQIKTLLYNIAYYGTESKKTERASYSGGAYTGIGIKTKDLELIKDDPNYEVLKDVLSKCIASRYLEKRVINSEQESITVFYLNRWLCVHFDLPLAYGGWKKCNIANVQKMCLKSFKGFDLDQFYMQDF